MRASARGRPYGALPSESMSEPLRLTIVYEDACDGDGWVVARIPQVRGAISQGATREQARENVIDALKELLAVCAARPDAGAHPRHDHGSSPSAPAPDRDREPPKVPEPQAPQAGLLA